MSFFIAPNEGGADYVAENMRTMPEFQDRYDAIKELKDVDRQGLSLSLEDAAKANGFFRVASFQGPVLDLAKLLDADFMKDKRKFYAFVDRHPELCTYDRRKAARPTKIVMSDGKQIL